MKDLPGAPDYRTLSSLLSLGLTDTTVQEVDDLEAPEVFRRLEQRDIVPVCPIAHSEMSQIWRAVDRRTQREVAVKLLPRLGAESARQFLHNESLILRDLAHPGIVGLIEAEVEGSDPYLVTGFVEGQTLAEMLSQTVSSGRFFEDSATAKCPQESVTGWNLYRDLLQIIAYLHRRGVVHRDLKPANVLVDAFGGMTVIDFGLAARVDYRAVSALPVVQVAGTRRYMAPELLGQPGVGPDPRQDVYALGRILEEFLRRWTGGRRAESYQIRRLRQLVTDCCSPRIGSRPTDAGEVLQYFDKTVQHSTRHLARVGPLAAVMGLALLVASVVAVDEWMVRPSAQEMLMPGTWESSERQEPVLPGGSLEPVIKSIGQGHFAEARYQLSNVPPVQRGWTWHHLQRRLQKAEGRRDEPAYHQLALPDHPLLAGDLTPSGGRYAFLTSARQLWEGPPEQLVGLMPPNGGRADTLAYDESGRYLVVAFHRAQRMSLEIRDVQAGRWIFSIELETLESVYRVARAQHAGTILIYGSDGQVMRCLELSTRTWRLRSLDIEGTPVLRMPPGRPLVSQVIDEHLRSTQLRIWTDQAWGEPAYTWVVPSVPAAVDVSLEAGRVAVLTREAVVEIYDLHNQALLARRVLPSSLASTALLMFDPSGTELILANADWTQVYGVKDLNCLITLPEGIGLGHCVTMAMDYTGPAIQIFAGNGIHRWSTDTPM